MIDNQEKPLLSIKNGVGADTNAHPLVETYSKLYRAFHEARDSSAYDSNAVNAYIQTLASQLQSFRPELFTHKTLWVVSSHSDLYDMACLYGVAKIKEYAQFAACNVNRKSLLALLCSKDKDGETTMTSLLQKALRSLRLDVGSLEGLRSFMEQSFQPEFYRFMVASNFQQDPITGSYCSTAHLASFLESEYAQQNSRALLLKEALYQSICDGVVIASAVAGYAAINHWASGQQHVQLEDSVYGSKIACKIVCPVAKFIETLLRVSYEPEALQGWVNDDSNTAILDNMWVKNKACAEQVSQWLGINESTYASVSFPVVNATTLMGCVRSKIQFFRPDMPKYPQDLSDPTFVHAVTKPNLMSF